VDEIPAPKDEEEDQVIARILRESAHSAAKLAIKMERRINTHLILGVLVGVAGLAVWWISFHLGPGGPEVGPDKKADFTLYLEQAIPRITILLFIELLAGFFLRQYRIGVEDLKYFLELRRRADAKRIAYAIYALVDENQAKIDFANAIMKEQSDTRLASGESTTSLKAMEEEKNEMMQAFTTLADKFENVAKAFKGGK
jgi:hypothetical protein